MVKLDALHLHTTDVMKVQLVKRPTNKVKYLVIRVLSYNEQEVDEAINDDDISKFAVFEHAQKSVGNKPTQGDFFE